MTRMRTFLVGSAAAALVLAAAPAAFAHAAYKSSNPADGSTVSSPPGTITAEFTEPLTDSSSMSVFDPCGQQVDNGDSNPNGYNMSVTMSGDKAGTYTVEFKAQSALDAHVTSGSFTFTSSGGAPCPGSEPPPEPKGGGGGGSGGGSGGSGGGSTGGAATPEDPSRPTATGGSAGGNAPAGGGAGGGAAGGGPEARKDGARNRAGGRSGGSAPTGPVAFQPAGGRTQTTEPAPWDLPLDGVVLALALCVMIGAAGGRVYAGIVAPPRR